MKFKLIFFLTCCIEISSQLTGNVCSYEGYENYCCANSENINGICTQCKIGTTSDAGGQCMPCTNNTFGYKCAQTCVCKQSQRCDAKAGCILNTKHSMMHTSKGPTKQVMFPNETVIANETTTLNDTTVIMNGTSISGWIIVTLCIAGCIILTGLGYLIRTYRQRLSVKSRIKNEGSILEPLGPAPYIGVYDEIDENPLTFDTADSNVTPQEPHYETVDCVSQERLSITSSTEHDDTGYLDPYFALEDESDKLQDRTSQTECSSTNSSDSDVVDQDIIAYKNIYQPLQKNWQDNSHGYEIPVMVHEGFECSAGFDENTTSNSYYNVYKPLQKDMDITNPTYMTYENQKSPETKAGNDKGFYGDACSSKITTGNLHDYINMQAESKISINNCDEMESCKPFDEDNVKKIDQQSFSGDF